MLKKGFFFSLLFSFFPKTEKGTQNGRVLMRLQLLPALVLCFVRVVVARRGGVISSPLVKIPECARNNAGEEHYQNRQGGGREGRY
jgi:hypothetical protein